MKILLHRGYHTSAATTSFHLEIGKLKQLLSSNIFPIETVEKKTFMQVLNCLMKPTFEPKKKINFHPENQMTFAYKEEEQKTTKDR